MTTESNSSQNPQATEDKQQKFHIHRVYLKDLSFEAPLGHKAFTAKEQLKIDQELGTEVKKIDEHNFETILRLTVTAKLEDETAFLVEVHQAGLFHIQGLEKQALLQVLNTVCPQILFPYTREAIDSALIKGSFPPVMLPPVNFDVLFAQAMADKEAQKKKKKPH
ncbi:MAG: preprotein translocase subunit SecB [Cellvibrionaceae bacterium]|jgi:preprotein translocase subunit SecB